MIWMHNNTLLKKSSLLNTPWGVLSTIVVRLPLRVSQYTLKGVSVTLTYGVPINFKVVYITPLGVSINSLAVFSKPLAVFSKPLAVFSKPLAVFSSLTILLG